MIEFDVLVIGSGIAGLYTALNIKEPLKVLLISKGDVQSCNTRLAQGGVACVLSDEDSFDEHIKDSLIAGKYENDIKNLNIMVREGQKDILNLIDLGVKFDRNSFGDYDLTLEGGHSKRRVLHYRDKTGEEIHSTLLSNLLLRPNIIFLENTMAVDVLKEKDFFITSLISSFNGKSVSKSYRTADLNEIKNLRIKSKTVVLATGGIGSLYKNTTNSDVATGDGLVLAHSLGASLENLSYIQFHPTGFHNESDRRLLISESLRGEGAHLLNSSGDKFMDKLHPMGALAPRDIVSSYILDEMKKENSVFVYLDITHEDPCYLSYRFPTIFQGCMENGIDISKSKIPVSPCQHYFMGGIKVNANSLTSVDGLYAVGECSFTGVHGKNRLASNSLLESLVFSRRCASDIEKKVSASPFKKIVELEPLELEIPKDLYDNSAYKKEIRDSIKSLMEESYFVRVDREKSKRAIKTINTTFENFLDSDIYKDKDYFEILSMLTLSKMILKEALND